MAKRKSIRKKLESSNAWSQLFKIPLNHRGNRTTTYQPISAQHEVSEPGQHPPRGTQPVNVAVAQQPPKPKPSNERQPEPPMPEYSVAQTLPEDLLFIIYTLLGVKASVQVSHICRHWRAAALNYNAFWCVFRPGLRTIHALSAHISRTRIGPIDLYVDENLIFRGPTVIFDTIQPKAPQIRTLFLHGQQFSVFFPQIISSLHRLPDLECLSLTATDAVRDWLTQSQRFESLAQLTKLRFLQIESSFIAHAIEYLPPSLTTLCLQAGDLNNNRFRWITEDQLGLILANPTLENLSLCGSLFSSAGDHTFLRIAAPPIAETRIKSLRYHGDYHVFGNFHARIKFPELKTLTLAAMNICQLNSAFATAFKHVESLELIQCVVNARTRDFMAWLSLLPKLRHLTLVGGNAIDGFRICFLKENVTRKPELETLACPSVLDNVTIKQLYFALKKKGDGPRLLVNQESKAFIGESEEELKVMNVGETTYAWPPEGSHDPNGFAWKYTRFESRYKF